MQSPRINGRIIGHDQPAYLIGEIGINHNGSIELAKKLIDAAVFAGFEAVKFQKRTPELCVPESEREIPRDTPWGRMSYFEYKKRIEFGEAEYREIDDYCKQRGITWFASPWDLPSLEFLLDFDTPCIKIASASLTDDDLLQRAKASGKVLILSTGMSTPEQIDKAVGILGQENLILLHATSAYPCKPEELNLRHIQTLRERYPKIPIGYSGHETGLQTTVAASVLGACVIERHITLDRAMWGTDHAASVEPQGMFRLVRDIRVVEKALGDGKKVVYDSEIPIMKKLRVKP